jgi:hypothetical protein
VSKRSSYTVQKWRLTLVTTAAIIGGSALASGALSSSSSKKASGGDSGSATLAAIAEQLFGQTSEHRQVTLDRAIAALLGQLDLGSLPNVQQRRSATVAERGRVRAAQEGELARLGLRDSSFGLQALEDIDRETASLLVAGDVAEQERLSRLAETIGFGVIEPSLGAAGQLARNQSAQQIAFQQSQSQGGQALGQALAQLFAPQRGGTTVNVNTRSGLPQTYDQTLLSGGTVLGSFNE